MIYLIGVLLLLGVMFLPQYESKSEINILFIQILNPGTGNPLFIMDCQILDSGAKAYITNAVSSTLHGEEFLEK